MSDEFIGYLLDCGIKLANRGQLLDRSRCVRWAGSAIVCVRKAMDLAGEAVGDILNDAQIKFYDAVGQYFDLLTFKIKVFEDVFEAMQGVHAFKKQHENASEDVFTL